MFGDSDAMRYSNEYVISLLAAGPGVICAAPVAVLLCVPNHDASAIAVALASMLIAAPLVLLAAAPGIPVLAIAVSRLMPDPFHRPAQWLWLPVVVTALSWHIVIIDCIFRLNTKAAVSWVIVLPCAAVLTLSTVIFWVVAQRRTNRCNGLAMKSGGVDNPEVASH